MAMRNRNLSIGMAHSARMLIECVETWSMLGHPRKFYQLITMSTHIRKPSLPLSLRMVEDIHAETIRELETLISDCSRSKVSEYDLWTQGY